MTRVGLVISLLGIGTAALVAVLALQTVRAADARIEADHLLLAERVFEECERELAQLVRREDERPFTHYRYFLVPDDLVPGTTAIARSPLALGSRDPAILGWFQVDPNGRISSPEQPDDPELAKTSFGWRPSPAAEAMNCRVNCWAEENPRVLPVSSTSSPDVAAPGPLPVADPVTPLAPAGGDTVASAVSEQHQHQETVPMAAVVATTDTVKHSDPALLADWHQDVLAQRQQPAAGAQQSGHTDEARSDRSSVALGLRLRLAIGKFNNKRGGNQQQEVAAQQVYSYVAGPEDNNVINDQAKLRNRAYVAGNGNVPDSTILDPGQVQERGIGLLDQPWFANWFLADSNPTQAAEPSAMNTVQIDLEQQALGGAIASKLGVRPDATVTAVVDPMQGHCMGSGRHLLLRQVRINEYAYRQGLVLDLPALTRQVQDQVLAGSDLAPHLSLHWRHDISPLPQRTTAYRFDHVFDEPFQQLSLVIDMDPLPGRERRPLTVLLSLIIGSGVALVLGLVAVGRMAATRLEYARRRSDFVAAVSHELRTPLTSIRMYGEMLREGMVGSEAQRQRYYGTITAEGERLSRLVDNVLELARIERGETKADLRSGRLDLILAEAEAILGPHLSASGFALRVSCPQGLPPVQLDRDALIQALLNLVDNSVKFAAASTRKEVAVEVQSAASGPGLVISVRDYGPGAPVRHLRRLCEPFFRGERELTRRTKGTGIGLALVKGLIERMGGGFSVRNHPEGGFEARILLPG